MMHKHSQEMSEAFFAGCCYGVKLANSKDMHQLLHMVSSKRTQVNLQNLAGSELLGVDYMELGELQKGPSRFTQKMASLK